MSLSREVSQAKSAISAITTDNIETQKPKASGAVDDVGGIGRQIAGLARQAEGNDVTISGGVTRSRSGLSTLESAKHEFTTTLTNIQRELQEAHTRFQDALTNAEQTFNTSFASAQNALNGAVDSIESANDSNKGLHNQIQDLAS
ncbi:hypothetical protein KA050_01515 [Candidatus Gracilibacteria bacterium]|nr:hypothetical protein [Candidatus Gracilibacteria bacterium]